MLWNDKRRQGPSMIMTSCHRTCCILRSSFILRSWHRFIIISVLDSLFCSPGVQDLRSWSWFGACITSMYGTLQLDCFQTEYDDVNIRSYICVRTFCSSFNANDELFDTERRIKWNCCYSNHSQIHARMPADWRNDFEVVEVQYLRKDFALSVTNLLPADPTESRDLESGCHSL